MNLDAAAKVGARYGINREQTERFLMESGIQELIDDSERLKWLLKTEVTSEDGRYMFPDGTCMDCRVECKHRNTKNIHIDECIMPVARVCLDCQQRVQFSVPETEAFVQATFKRLLHELNTVTRQEMRAAFSKADPRIIGDPSVRCACGVYFLGENGIAWLVDNGGITHRAGVCGKEGAADAVTCDHRDTLLIHAGSGQPSRRVCFACFTTLPVTPHTKHDPAACHAKAADDEPIFTLRAKDVTAPTVVAAWLKMNMPNLSEAKRHDAYDCLMDMYRWQRDNPTKVKRPD